MGIAYMFILSKVWLCNICYLFYFAVCFCNTSVKYALCCVVLEIMASFQCHIHFFFRLCRMEQNKVVLLCCLMNYKMMLPFWETLASKDGEKKAKASIIHHSTYCIFVPKTA